jgi:hypothetical protein
MLHVFCQRPKRGLLVDCWLGCISDCCVLELEDLDLTKRPMPMTKATPPMIIVVVSSEKLPVAGAGAACAVAFSGVGTGVGAGTGCGTGCGTGVGEAVTGVGGTTGSVAAGVGAALGAGEAELGAGEAELGAGEAELGAVVGLLVTGALVVGFVVGRPVVVGLAVGAPVVGAVGLAVGRLVVVCRSRSASPSPSALSGPDAASDGYTPALASSATTARLHHHTGAMLLYKRLCADGGNAVSRVVVLRGARSLARRAMMRASRQLCEARARRRKERDLPRPSGPARVRNLRIKVTARGARVQNNTAAAPCSSAGHASSMQAAQQLRPRWLEVGSW